MIGLNPQPVYTYDIVRNNGSSLVCAFTRPS
jgi:hypothetical protein